MTRTGRGAHRRPTRRLHPSHWGRRTRVVALLTVLMLSGGVAIAAWVVGLNGGSNGQAKAGSVANLTVTAASSPAPGNTLYPGGTGDVVVTISNPNAFPVTITAVNLPTNTTYAAGYSDSGLSSAIAGCTSGTSAVSYSFGTAVSGTSHTLTTPLIVAASGAANNPLVVTLTNAATMGSGSATGCQGAHFSMPSFTGITATAGGGTATTSPATTAWTS
jgi:hypothetical protein